MQTTTTITRRRPEGAPFRTNEPIFRIHVVSADARLRRLTRRFVDLRGYAVESFATADAFLADGLALRPDCVVLDHALPAGTACDVQLTAQQGPMRVPVVFVGGADATVADAVQAMRSGAIDFLCMPVTPADLEAAIARAVEVAGRWQVEDVRRMRALELADRLTPRERAVLALVLKGRLNKQIAAELNSQEATVKVHRSRLMRKLEVRTLAQLLEFGRELGHDFLLHDAPPPRALHVRRDVATRPAVVRTQPMAGRDFPFRAPVAA